ncbi:hypothetical protein Tco_1411747 [Tanacetum coccineum]
MALPPRDQRHQYLRFEGLGYTDVDITDFEERLGGIYGREIHRVQVFDFGGLTDLVAEGLSGRMLMEHRDSQGQSVFTRRTWRRLFDIRGPLVHKLILRSETPHEPEAVYFGLGLHTTEKMESAGFGAYWADSARQVPDKGDLSAYWVGIPSVLIACSIAGRSQAPEKVTVTDLFYLRGMDVGSVNIPYLLARYLRLFASGRKREAMISGGQFVARMAEHFGLLTEERLQGVTVIVRDLPMIDMAELVRLQICEEFDDTWAWVAPRPKK